MIAADAASGSLEERGELARHHLLHAARADLLRRMGRWAEAARSYREALELASNEPERQFSGGGWPRSRSARADRPEGGASGVGLHRTVGSPTTTTAAFTCLHAQRFAPLPPERADRFAACAPGSQDYFPGVVGIKLEEIRTDYARMRLPSRSNLNQPAGVVHGGAIATLIDTVAVPPSVAATTRRTAT